MKLINSQIVQKNDLLYESKNKLTVFRRLPDAGQVR
jgi:hypothetical protein